MLINMDVEILINGIYCSEKPWCHFLSHEEGDHCYLFDIKLEQLRDTPYHCNSLRCGKCWEALK